LVLETALLIERHASTGNIDETFTDKSFEELNDATRLFEHTCICERTVTLIKSVKV
jgi:hypothetical protein